MKRSTLRSRRTRSAGRLDPRALVRFPLRMTIAVREERKVLTAVFADVVGSTALAERLDPEDVKLVVGEAVARIVGEVEASAGTSRISPATGPRVLRRADDARGRRRAGRALRAAHRREMEEYAREVRRGWGAEGFGVRVGVGDRRGRGGRGRRRLAGRVRGVRRHGQRRGAAAVRGRARARSSSTTQRTARSSALRVGRAAGARAEREERARLPAWPAAVSRPADVASVACRAIETRLVGRSRELGLGREALEALRAGAAASSSSAGDAGIGKSRLLDELRAARGDADGSLLARGPLRLLRRVAAVLAVPRPPARRVDRRRRPTSPSCASASVSPPARAALRDGAASELYPYLGGLLEVALEHEAAARTASSRRRRSSGGRSRSWTSCFAARSRSGRARARGRGSPLGRSDLGAPARTAALVWPRRPPSCSSSRCGPILTTPSSGLRELAAASSTPTARARLDAAGARSATRTANCSTPSSPPTLPAELERRVLEGRGQSVLPRGAGSSRSPTSGALVRPNGGWRFDHAIEVEVPPTVEQVILARLDRLSASGARARDRGVGARPAVRAAAARGRRAGRRAARIAPRAAAARPAPPEPGAGPQPEYRFKPCADPGNGVPDARSAERADAASIARRRSGSSGATRGARGRGARPPRPPLARGRGREEGGRLPDCGPATRRGSSTRSTRRSSTTANCSSSSKRRGESPVRSPSSSSSSRSRCIRRSGSPRRTTRTRMRSITGQPVEPRRRDGRASVATSFLPNDVDPADRDRVAEHPGSACSSSTASSRRGPSGRSSRRSPSAGRSPTTGSATSSICAKGSRGRTARR